MAPGIVGHDVEADSLERSGHSDQCRMISGAHEAMYEYDDGSRRFGSPLPAAEAVTVRCDQMHDFRNGHNNAMCPRYLNTGDPKHPDMRPVARFRARNN